MQLANEDSAPVTNRAIRRHPGKPFPEPVNWPTKVCAPWEQNAAPATPNISVPRRKVPQPLEAINHPGAHLRSDVVLALVGVSRSQWYRMVAAGTAPAALRYGPRCSRWLASDITKFLAERTAQGVQK